MSSLVIILGISIISNSKAALVATDAGTAVNIELFGSGGSMGGTVAGQGVMRLNAVTQTPTGTVVSGGLVYVLGNDIRFLGASGVDKKLNEGVDSYAELSDRNQPTQEAGTDSITGTTDFDMTRQIQDITITGNVSTITFSNEPLSSVRGTWILDMYQDATGGHTIDWVGSGVKIADDETASDMQPLSTALANTQYWLYWNGSYWTMSIKKIGLTAL